MYPQDGEGPIALLRAGQIDPPAQLALLLRGLPQELHAEDSNPADSSKGDTNAQPPLPEPQIGGRLCAALSHLECATGEALWIEKVLEPGLRLVGGRVPSASVAVTRSLGASLWLSASLAAYACRLTAYERLHHACLALSLATHARKLWHLHLDASVPPTSFSLQPESAATESMEANVGSPPVGSARTAATLSVHCLRWVLQVCSPARRTGQGLEQSTDPIQSTRPQQPSPPSRVQAPHPSEEELRTRAHEELATCLLTEAGLLARLSPDAAALLLREGAHKSARAALSEVAQMLRGEAGSWYTHMLLGRSLWALGQDLHGCLHALGTAVAMAEGQAPICHSQALHELAAVQSALLEDSAQVGREQDRAAVLSLLHAKGVCAVMERESRAHFRGGVGGEDGRGTGSGERSQDDGPKEEYRGSGFGREGDEGCDKVETSGEERRGDSFEKAESRCDGRSVWVRCCRCKRWRSVAAELLLFGADWECRDNQDASHASCEAPQEPLADGNGRGLSWEAAVLEVLGALHMCLSAPGAGCMCLPSPHPSIAVC